MQSHSPSVSFPPQPSVSLLLARHRSPRLPASPPLPGRESLWGMLVAAAACELIAVCGLPRCRLPCQTAKITLLRGQTKGHSEGQGTLQGVLDTGRCLLGLLGGRSWSEPWPARCSRACHHSAPPGYRPTGPPWPTQPGAGVRVREKSRWGHQTVTGRGAHCYRGALRGLPKAFSLGEQPAPGVWARPNCKIGVKRTWHTPTSLPLAFCPLLIKHSCGVV